MKQNSTGNMILRHLKDIKAKIEQKSINNVKLPFEGPSHDKYAGRSPERILCLYSIRLVSSFKLSEKLLSLRISTTWVNQMRLLCHHSFIIIDNVNNVDDVVIATVFGQLKSLYS